MTAFWQWVLVGPGILAELVALFWMLKRMAPGIASMIDRWVEHQKEQR